MDLCAHLSGSESIAVACLLELDAGTKKMPDNAFPVVLVLPGRERSPSDPFRYLAKGCPCGHWVDGSPEWILASLEKSVHVSSFPSPAFFFLPLFCFSEWPKARAQSEFLYKSSVSVRMKTLPTVLCSPHNAVPGT